MHAWVQASRLWDWLVFNRMARRLGGRLRFVINGGAALSRQVGLASSFTQASLRGSPKHVRVSMRSCGRPQGWLTQEPEPSRPQADAQVLCRRRTSCV